jgi:hypothetical protein
MYSQEPAHALEILLAKGDFGYPQKRIERAVAALEYQLTFFR